MITLPNARLTSQDYLKAQYLHLRPRPLIKWVGLFLIVLALGLALRGLFFSGENGSWSPHIILGGLGYFGIMYLIILPCRTRKIFRQQKTLQISYDIQLSEEALESVSAEGRVRMQWKNFHKYKIGQGMILVYQADALYHMFPKRWFSEEQFLEFQNILRRQLGKSQV